MSDHLAYAFTIYFATLGPVKTIPAFFLATQGVERRTTVTLALRSAIVATVIVLFVALVATGTLVTWRVSTDALAIAGGIVLLMSAMKMLTGFQIADTGAPAGSGAPARLDASWMGRPVLSPLAVPAIVTPVGVVVVLYFSGLALGNQALQTQLVGLLLVIMAMNLAAMLFAGPIMRVVGVPVLQVIGWVFSALQAGLAVEAVIGAVRRLALAGAVVLLGSASANAQELDVRVFSAAPIGTTIVLASAGGSRGSILFDPAVGVADVQADLRIFTPGFGYTFNLAGRQARILVVAPFVEGAIAGNVHAQGQRQDLRGFADPRIKLSVGLWGGPALTAAQLASAPRRGVVGASVTVMPPIGQYRTTQLVNLGYHRWAVKPELGVTRPIGRWTIDAATGVWLFTANRAYYPGHLVKEQDPLFSVQGHVSYTFQNRIWAAAHGTWFAGGETRTAGVVNPDLQRNTRVGATVSFPMGRAQSLKVVFSTGATTRRGTDFDNLSVTYQFVRF